MVMPGAAGRRERPDTVGTRVPQADTVIIIIGALGPAHAFPPHNAPQSAAIAGQVTGRTQTADLCADGDPWLAGSSRSESAIGSHHGPSSFAGCYRCRTWAGAVAASGASRDVLAVA